MKLRSIAVLFSVSGLVLLFGLLWSNYPAPKALAILGVLGLVAAAGAFFDYLKNGSPEAE